MPALVVTPIAGCTSRGHRCNDAYCIPCLLFFNTIQSKLSRISKDFMTIKRRNKLTNPQTMKIEAVTLSLTVPSSACRIGDHISSELVHASWNYISDTSILAGLHKQTRFQNQAWLNYRSYSIRSLSQASESICNSHKRSVLNGSEPNSNVESSSERESYIGFPRSSSNIRFPERDWPTRKNSHLHMTDSSPRDKTLSREKSAFFSRLLSVSIPQIREVCI